MRTDTVTYIWNHTKYCLYPSETISNLQYCFLLYPDDQYYDLENDPENQAKREEEAARQEALNYAQTDKNKDDTATDDSNPIDYNAYLTDMVIL